MPVILPRGQGKLWLHANLGKDGIQSMLVPYDTNEMEAYPVAKSVNKLGCNISRPEVTDRQEYPDLPEV